MPTAKGWMEGGGGRAEAGKPSERAPGRPAARQHSSGGIPGTRARLATAAKYVPTLAYLLFFHVWAWNLFVAVMTVGAVLEFRMVLGRIWPSSSPALSSAQDDLRVGNSAPLAVPDYVLLLSAGVLAAAAVSGSLAVLNAVTASTVVVLLASHFLDGSLTASVDRARMYELAIRVAALIYIAWPLAHANMISVMPKYGAGFMFVALYSSWFGDGAGYFVGKRIGATPLVPTISPNKTVEGLVANVLLSVVPLLVLYLLRLFGLWTSVLPPSMSFFGYIGLGLTLGILGPMGDLLESYIKRAANVKDSGDFFPGHGGILDRFDSFLLSLPCFYYVVLALYG